MLEGIVDREAELSALQAAWQRALTGVPCIVSIEGAPGIGKTALLTAFRARLQGTQSFLVTGDDSETILQYGVASQLLRQFGPSAPSSREVANGDSLQDVDPFKVGAMLLECLGEIQAEGPVVLIIEDAHWADRDSLQALVFAFRRLLADQVLLLLSVRDESVSRLPSGLLRLLDEQRGSRIRLKGLPPSGVRNLGERLGWQLSRTAALRLQQHTGGNPLYVKALLTDLEPSALEVDWQRPLPSPKWFHQLVLRRIEECSESAQELIRATSVLGTHCTVERAIQLSGMHATIRALDEALASGLLVVKETALGPELHFEHPLVRADIYHALPLGKRTALHRGAAELSSEEAVSLHHQVAAANGHDEELGARVEDFARGEVNKSSWTTAATAFLSAARLYSHPKQCERCILDAMDCRILAGDVAAIQQLAGRLRGHSTGAHHDYISARLLMLSGAVAKAGDLYGKAWAEVTSEPEPNAGLAARVAGWHAAALQVQGRAREAIDWAQRALQSGPSEFSRSSFAPLVLLVAQASVGQAAAALQTLAELPSDSFAIDPQHCEQLLGRGVLRMVLDDVVGARSDMTRAAELARQQGTPFLLTLALTFLTDIEYRLGEWDSAIAHGEQSSSTAEDSDQTFIAGWAHAIAAFPHIGRGAFDQAELHIRSAERAGEAGRLSVTIAHAALARARLEIVKGRPALAAQSLEAFLKLNAEPAEEPGGQPWRLVYAEALCEQDHLAAAGDALGRAECQILQRPLPSLLITVGRIRGELERRAGRSERAVEVFAEALSTATTVAAPFEVARLELAYGSLVRRLGRRRAAKEALESARERFLGLQARPFVNRCDTELSGTGLKPRRRTVDKRNLLTSQELAVARLVAQGLSNRETAAQLVVSPKTVEYHLGNIFGKLGVRSRSQLVHHFMRAS